MTRISVTDCDESSKVCLLKRFTNATIELDFELGTMFIACLFFLIFNDSIYSTEIVEDAVVESVTTVVHGILLDEEIEFPLENSNSCQNGISCPLTKGQIHKYVQSLPVKVYYPPVSVENFFLLANLISVIKFDAIIVLPNQVHVTVKWELEDAQTNKTIVCVLIPARITVF